MLWLYGNPICHYNLHFLEGISDAVVVWQPLDSKGLYVLLEHFVQGKLGSQLGRGR